jgi:hypothetical protein
MELGVDVWTIICSHIDWRGNLYLFKSMSLMSKMMYKAIRFGATPFVRWNIMKGQDLLLERSYFFVNKIEAITVKHGKWSDLIRTRLPNAKDVKYIIKGGHRSLYEFRSDELHFYGLEHLHIHLKDSAIEVRIHELPKGLKSFSIGQDDVFDNHKCVLLPSVFPESLKEIILRVAVVNGGMTGLDNDTIPRLPENLQRFEFVGKYADDRFFEESKNMEKLEALTIITDDFQKESTLLQDVVMPNLKELTLVSIDEEHPVKYEIDMNKYPDLEYCAFNIGYMINIKKHIVLVETGIHDETMYGEIDRDYRFSKVYFDDHTLKKKIKRN